MVAALLFIAILDFGPLFNIDANTNAILTLLAALVFVVVHGAIALGWRNIIAFSLITVIISFTSEVIGVATGVIFGAYHYTDLLGPSQATGSGTMAAATSASRCTTTPAGSAPSSRSCLS